MAAKDLTPWKEGQSGNPNGRPKGSKNRSTIVREIAEALASGHADKTNIEVATMEVMLKAMTGDVNAWEKIMDSGWGKLTDKKEVEMAVTRNDDLTTKVLAKIPTEELEDILNADNE